MTNIRKQKTGDQLAVGDWLAPGQITDGAAEVLFAHAYPASADRSRDNHGKHVRLVVRELGKAKTYSDVVAGTTLFVLASDEELAEYREEGERAQRIADIRAFADWLEDNPWAPLPCSFDAQVHLDERHLGGPSVADALAKVREVAPRLGVELEERLDDRTCARKSFGSVGYDVIAWHPNGRPDESRTGETVEDLGKNFDRSQTADADTTPPPVVGRRREPHTGGVTDEGLVDETASRLSMGWNGPCVASLHIPTPGENCLVCDAEGMRYGEHVEVSATAAETCSAQCACGTEVSGFDSLAEAEAELAIHIRDASATCLGRDMDCGRKLPCPDHPAAELASES